jgi:hypothetical protein
MMMLSKFARASVVDAQFATGSVALPMMPTVDVVRPKRERLAEVLAAVCDVPRGEAVATPVDRQVGFATDGDGAAWVVYRRGGPGSATVRYRLAVTDPREAWEVLCQRLDLAGWVDDPRRRFERVDLARPITVDINPGGAMLARTGNVDLLPHPATVADCVAFASDVPNVLAAEALAREIGARSKFGPIERIAWRYGGDPPPDAQPWIVARGFPDGSRWADLMRRGYAVCRYDQGEARLWCPEIDA